MNWLRCAQEATVVNVLVKLACFAGSSETFLLADAICAIIALGWPICGQYVFLVITSEKKIISDY